jgi:hypothetical protein
VDTAVIALWISGVAIVVSFAASIFSGIAAERVRVREEGKRRAEDRQIAAKEHLDHHREPLLLAVDELGHRLSNIRNGQFWVYTRADGHHGRQARLSTLYRLARYFGVLERLYNELGVLKLETETQDSDRATREIGEALNNVGRAFASDGHGWGAEFMLWREEQRAIGERMIKDPDASETRVIGYAEFVDAYDVRFEPWLGRFEDGLRLADLESEGRLLALHRQLARLALKLDPEQLYIDRDRPPDNPKRRAWWVEEKYRASG